MSIVTVVIVVVFIIITSNNLIISQNAEEAELLLNKVSENIKSYDNIYINYTKYILNCPGTTIFEYTNKKWRIPEKMVLYY